MSTGLAVEPVAAPQSVPAPTSLWAPDPLDPGRPLEPLIAEYSAIYGPSWKSATARKHRDDFSRLLRWLAETGRPVTTTSLDFLTLAAYVTDLRRRSRIHGVWRGSPDAARRSEAAGQPETLSANTVNTYVRPLRSLAIWLVDEGLLASNPFRRSRRRAALNPLLPAEDTPTKGATLEDLQALERGCAGGAPIDLRDRAIVAVLVTTAARNSSVRLLRRDDVDLERGVIRFRRAKGDKTLEIALHASARAAIEAYLAAGRPALVKAVADRGYQFPSRARASAPLSMNALSQMLNPPNPAGGGSLAYFGSHRIRHATATFLVNNGMPLEEVSRYLGHSSTEVTRRYARHTTETLGDRAAEARARDGNR
jgi:site-specific recombinase XerD